ncbi:hypothetical protein CAUPRSCDRAFT_13128 [Caulochytrium protostelioides]|uniref:Uncharacterized protein n=1 Tax=Caulochytrium protostelioides TaxID=1555241 RepID=A0A4V1ISY0_9FUNG|nr:hypothetical protein CAUPRSCDRAFT_13128 [Caulochytrium protostelioides]
MPPILFDLNDADQYLETTARELEAIGLHEVAARERARKSGQLSEARHASQHTIIRDKSKDGDSVLIQDPSANKFEPRWFGPFTVRASYPDFDAYQLAFPSGQLYPTRIHSDMLKLAKLERPTTELWYYKSYGATNSRTTNRAHAPLPPVDHP